MANLAPAAKSPAGPQDPGGVITSQFRRRLAQASYRANSVVSVDIPRDDVFKRIFIRMTGSVSVTYGAGSPVIGGLGMLPRLVARIDIVQNGQDTIKSLDPYMVRMQNVLVSGSAPERAYTSQAGAFTTREALTESVFGGPAYQATTGYMLFNESIAIYFEHPFMYEMGKSVSLWNTKGLSSAELRFAFNAQSNLLEDGNSASVTYADDLATLFDIELISAPAIPRESDFMLYKQTVRRVQFSAQSRDVLVDLPRGNLLSGIHLLARNGDTNKRLSDIAITDLALLINGQRLVQKTTFITLQRENRINHGISDYRGSASQGITHLLQGYAYMGLVRDGDVRTCLDTRVANNVDLVQLAVSTAASSGNDAATYTNPVELTIMTDELAPPVQRI